MVRIGNRFRLHRDTPNMEYKVQSSKYNRLTQVLVEAPRTTPVAGVRHTYSVLYSVCPSVHLARYIPRSQEQGRFYSQSALILVVLQITPTFLLCRVPR